MNKMTCQYYNEMYCFDSSIFMLYEKFCFCLQSSKGNFTYWRCSKRSKAINCPATVSQKVDDFKKNSREHIHPADKGALKKTICRREVKLKCFIQMRISCTPENMQNNVL
jgi:hypothetical protein